MTAKLDARVAEIERSSEAVTLILVRHAVRPKPHLRCPTCGAVLYTRRHKLCGVCGEPLPDELLFSTAEASRVNALLRVEQQRHRVWMSRRETEHLLRRADF